MQLFLSEREGWWYEKVCKWEPWISERCHDESRQANKSDVESNRPDFLSAVLVTELKLPNRNMLSLTYGEISERKPSIDFHYLEHKYLLDEMNSDI